MKGKGRKSNKTTVNSSEGSKLPAKREDVLDRDVAVVAALEQNGLHVKAKSRAFAAFDRLLGNIIDYPSSLIEKRVNYQRDEGQLQSELRSIQHDKIVEIAREASPEEVYFRRYCAEQMEKDKNKLLVGIAAVEELKRLPPPQSTTEQEGSIDADWLNEYVDIAGKKSCEDIQRLWGKLLAGEIRAPGTYNLRILQRLAAIDSAEAEKINKFLIYAISNRFVFRDDLNAIPDISFNIALEMEDLGVLSVGGGTLHTQIVLPKDSSSIFVLSGDVLKLTAEEPTTIQIPVFPLAALGKALAALILLENTPAGYIDKIVSNMRGPHLKIEIAKILETKSSGEPSLGDWQLVAPTPAASP